LTNLPIEIASGLLAAADLGEVGELAEAAGGAAFGGSRVGIMFVRVYVATWNTE
jgi:hypothetical protein